jgi:hypothetical protein
MSPQAKWEYMKAIDIRYHQAKGRKEKGRILDEFCKTYGCHRKHALRLLNGPTPGPERAKRHPRGSPYADGRLLAILEEVWEASGYLCGQRLKPALALWMPAIRKRYRPSPQEERLLLAISPATIDRRLSSRKEGLRRRIYGTTRPGTLLKHHIPIKTDSWDVDRPGFTEIDLVSHSGDCAEGDFAHTLNMADVFSGWVERRCVLGKGQDGVRAAIDDMRRELPFDLLGIDSDNGSEFINDHLWRYCQAVPQIQFTRGRPYKKDDNAHIEQKNWTHVRKLLGYGRQDTPAAVSAINDLYRHELRWFQNFFQPSVKLARKVRIGSRLHRVYDAPKTPWERVLESCAGNPARLEMLRRVKDQLDPFGLSKTIEQKLDRIWAMRSKAPKPSWLRQGPNPYYHSRTAVAPSKRPQPWPALRSYQKIYSRETTLQTW